ncbi:MAG: hypothetical protein JWR21_499 [Herminiimonas sp.]|nr:hypothetical protein [Herminiimonas sp.]MDB5852718.1 hypothetical protein [Herminiimonas sp.]
MIASREDANCDTLKLPGLHVMVPDFEVTDRVLAGHRVERLNAEPEELLERERAACADAERASLAEDEFLRCLVTILENATSRTDQAAIRSAYPLRG